MEAIIKGNFVKNDSILNAFAIPGGHIYIYTGLLKYLDSEAALAGVLAHEIAHAEKRHATWRTYRDTSNSLLKKSFPVFFSPHFRRRSGNAPR